MTLGDRIRIRLKAAGMAQNELARRAGLSSSGMSTIINGAYDPRLSSLQMIADVLQCSVGELIGETDAAVPVQSPEELRLLAAVARLNAQGMEKVIAYAEDLCETEKYIRGSAASAV